jgi:hypothetical protein
MNGNGKATRLSRADLPRNENQNFEFNLSPIEESEGKVATLPETNARQRYIKLLKDGIHKKEVSKSKRPEEKKLEAAPRGESKSRGQTEVPRPQQRHSRVLRDSTNTILPEQQFSYVENLVQEDTAPEASPVPQRDVSHSTSISWDAIAAQSEIPPSLSECSAEGKQSLVNSLLFSKELANLLAAAPTLKKESTAEITLAFSPPDSQWVAQFFRAASLPLPETIRSSLLAALNSPTDAPPVDIIGSPPLPLAPLPCMSTATMKTLTQIFEELQREAENISSRSFSLWSQRRNLLIGAEKVRGHLANDRRLASLKLDQYLAQVRSEEEEVQQFTDLIPLIDLANQRKEEQLLRNTELSVQMKEFEAGYLQALESAKNEFERKEDIASTTDEGTLRPSL